MPQICKYEELMEEDKKDIKKEHILGEEELGQWLAADILEGEHRPKKARGQQYERGGENKTLIGALLQIDFLVKRFSHTIINERVPELYKWAQ